MTTLRIDPNCMTAKRISVPECNFIPGNTIQHFHGQRSQRVPLPSVVQAESGCTTDAGAVRPGSQYWQHPRVWGADPDRSGQPGPVQALFGWSTGLSPLRTEVKVSCFDRLVYPSIRRTGEENHVIWIKSRNWIR